MHTYLIVLQNRNEIISKLETFNRKLNMQEIYDYHDQCGSEDRIILNFQYLGKGKVKRENPVTKA